MLQQAAEVKGFSTKVLVETADNLKIFVWHY